MSQDYTLDSAIDYHRLKQNQLSRTLFEKWFNENKLDDEYFTRHEMYWFAEQAWIAATIILQNPMRIRPMKTKGNEKRLLKDIVIPAGTVFRNQDGVTANYIDGNIYATIGLTKDSCGSLLIYGIDSRDKELKEWFEDII